MVSDQGKRSQPSPPAHAVLGSSNPGKTTIVCSTCRTLSLHGLRKPEDPAPKARNIMLDDLTGDESSNCATCSMLYRGVLGVVGDAISRYQYISFEPTTSSAKGPLRLDLWPRIRGTRRLKLQYYTRFGKHSRGSRNGLLTSQGKPSIWPTIGPTRDICENAASEACLGLASSWIADCMNKHPECQQPECRLLPTRLIDVGSNGDEPYLYIGHQEKGKYVALSHCWGGASPVTTTEASLENT